MDITHADHDHLPLTGCERFDARCSALLDKELSADEQHWMTLHQRSCASCDQLVRDLEALIADAKGVPGIRPSRDLWDAIAAQLDTPGTSRPVPGASSLSAPAGVPRGIPLRTLAIAATMLVAVSSGVTWRLATGTTRSDSTTTAATPLRSEPIPMRTVASDPDAVQNTVDVIYEREISALRTIVDDRFAELDTATVSELRRNLDIIDRAIVESRRALDRDPRSALVATQLDRALETKLALLRRVALL